MKDALALGGDEGRDKLRKAARRGKYPLSRADIRMGEPARLVPGTVYMTERTRGTETSKYPEEKKSTEMAQVAASERACSPNLCMCMKRQSVAAQGLREDPHLQNLPFVWRLQMRLGSKTAWKGRP